jgi:integrase
MAYFVFRCPTTSMNVQHWSDEDDDVPEHEYEGIICPACTRLHFLNEDRHPHRKPDVLARPAPSGRAKPSNFEPSSIVKIFASGTRAGPRTHRRLVEAGLTLIAAADSSASLSILAKARQVRNGLMVAMLALHPIRLKNFVSLDIGRTFIELQGSWWITLSAAETKEKRADERRIDELLTTALNLYLGKYRQALKGNNSESNALWLSSHNGAAMTYDGVARAITETTRSAVGIDVSPHMFRTSAASSAALHGGDNLHLGSALLHHRDKRVTEKNYNFASNLSAAQSLRDLIRNQL